MIVAIDGPAGSGKSTVALAARAEARLPAPRHGRDVPRADLARAARRRRRWTDGDGARASSRASILSRSRRGARSRSTGEDVSDGDPRRRDRPPRADRRATCRRCARSCASDNARWRSVGDTVIEGRDIGTVVAPSAEVKVFLVADEDERARRRAADRPGRRGRDVRRRSCADRTSRTPSTRSRPTTPCSSTRPSSRSTRSSSASRSWWRRAGERDRRDLGGRPAHDRHRGEARRAAARVRSRAGPARGRARRRGEPLQLDRSAGPRRGQPADALLHGQGRGAPRTRPRPAHAHRSARSRCGAASPIATLCGRCGRSCATGTRSACSPRARGSERVPGPVQPGAAMVAINEDVPLIPVAIHGSQTWRLGNFAPGLPRLG